MNDKKWTSGFFLILLAVIFSIGLTFASVELPGLLNKALYGAVPALEGDSHADQSAVFRTELFISHYHLRLIGYTCFGLMVVLIAALDEPDYWRRRAVVSALGDLGSEKAVHPLLTILDEPELDVHVKREIMVAFHKIGSKQTVEALKEALSDDDPEVRLYAEEALKRLGAGKRNIQ
jgi:hypothetical protein